MFGSLILPTPTGGGAAAAVTGTRITTTTTRSGIQSSPNLSSMPNNNYYHPTMSSFPSRNKLLLLLPRTRRRRRMMIRASFTTSTPAASSDTTTTLELPNNLYQILRINQNASSLEIKTAYRKLAKQFHPDALPPPPPTPTTSSSSSSSSSDGGGGGGAARDFMAIHNAYATLSDPTERARYDLSIQIHTRRYSTAVDGRRRSYGMQTTTRRWETDQCW